MKLCSQCQFIYEDEQERCDMDGAELVYEPTLEGAFPRNVQEAAVENREAEPLKIVIPLTKSLPADIRPSATVVKRSTVPLQIAAGLLTAVFAFAGYYVTRRALSPAGQQAPSIAKTRESNSFSSLIASASAMTTETPEPQKAEAEDLPAPATNKLQTDRVPSDPAVPPLPGLKPLPRLKPLPTLKPIPKLAEQNRSTNANRKSVIVTTKTTNDQKKESRLGSFLKKTGRALTKPFKS